MGGEMEKCCSIIPGSSYRHLTMSWSIMSHHIVHSVNTSSSGGNHSRQPLNVILSWRYQEVLKLQYHPLGLKNYRSTEVSTKGFKNASKNAYI